MNPCRQLMTHCCQLMAPCCQLMAPCCQLVAPCRQLMAPCCQLMAPCHQLMAHCWQLLAPCQQLTSWRPPASAHAPSWKGLSVCLRNANEAFWWTSRDKALLLVCRNKELWLDNEWDIFLWINYSKTKPCLMLKLIHGPRIQMKKRKKRLFSRQTWVLSYGRTIAYRIWVKSCVLEIRGRKSESISVKRKQENFWIFLCTSFKTASSAAAPQIVLKNMLLTLMEYKFYLRDTTSPWKLEILSNCKGTWFLRIAWLILPLKQHSLHLPRKNKNKPFISTIAISELRGQISTIPFCFLLVLC